MLEKFRTYLDLYLMTYSNRTINSTHDLEFRSIKHGTLEQDTSVEDGYETILNIGIEKLTNYQYSCL